MSDQQLTDTKHWLRERRSQRIEWNVPVVVHRSPNDGPQFYERTETLVISAHGALVALVAMVAPKQRLLVQNIASGEQQECRVVYVEKDLTGPTRVAVEFARPARRFWSILFPPADWPASA
jgi:acyl-CoA synthetase (NDP forming)